jgi:hypothetical protein
LESTPLFCFIDLFTDVFLFSKWWRLLIFAPDKPAKLRNRSDRSRQQNQLKKTVEKMEKETATRPKEEFDVARDDYKAKHRREMIVNAVVVIAVCLIIFFWSDIIDSIVTLIE